ncbi:MAG: CAP domain-containing protein [Candidatus Pacebacteria bacterium]|nr:CAP domain-containing protein [Candidatus Paceibacterota bacterium]
MLKIKRHKFIGTIALFFLLAFFTDSSAAQASALTSANVITLINQSRAEEGLSALAANAKLNLAAQNKAYDMFEQQYFEHIGPDGRNPEDWIEEAGYDWMSIGENIAYGYDTAESVHVAFMNSPGHRANILGDDYEHVGVAAVSGTFEGHTQIMVVEEFGATDAYEPPLSNTTYNTVTVNNGVGGGTYAVGDKVTIIANLPAPGTGFSKWTGSTQYLASTISYINTFTMPAANISFTATYQIVAPAVYTLAVNNGTGDGSYTSGTKITITANPPVMGKIFDKWTGDTSYIASATSATTTVTMPAKAIILTANYKDSPISKYSLTVANGSGDGSYASGTKVTIVASLSVTGQVFDKWTGDTSYIASTTSTTTTVTMPAKNIILIATYKSVPVTSYALTVTNGTGDGSYSMDTEISITADTPASGKIFDRWTGATSYVSDKTSPTAVVTMPAKAITLIATYRNIDDGLYLLSVANGSGDGYYAEGTKFMITADTPEDGKAFDKWIGDTGYLLNVNSMVTILTMPAKAIALTATYEDTVVVDVASDPLLIKTEDSPKIYVIIEGKKKWVSTPEVFEQLGYKWVDVVVVTEADLDDYADYEDNLIRVIGDVKVYLVVNGMKRHIPSPEIFLDYGFSWDDVKDVDRAVTDKYEEAYLIRASKGTDVYCLADGIRRLIPTADIFNSYNNDWADIQVISQTEMNAYPLSSLIKLSDSVDVYLIEGTVKKRIPSVVVFNKYNFDWSHISIVNQTEFNYYKIGAELK